MGIDSYKAIRNTIDIVILAVDDKPLFNERSVPDKGIQVLLVKRDMEPYNGMWTLPGGFVDYDKPLSQSVKDKLYQKTGICDMYTEQLYTYGEDIDRDPRDRVISIGYIALANKGRLILDTNKHKDIAWFWVNCNRDDKYNVTDIELVKVGVSDKYQLTESEKLTNLGFDHKKIIIDAINRLANKILYTDIGFNLVGKEFSIRELQLAYEAIIGKGIPGFRRIISNKIEKTGVYTNMVNDKPDLHRPAQLFKFKDN